MKIKPLTKITKVTASFVSNFQEILKFSKAEIMKKLLVVFTQRCWHVGMIRGYGNCNFSTDRSYVNLGFYFVTKRRVMFYSL